MGRETTKQRKERTLQALRKTLGVVSSACEKSGVNRRTFYLWYNKDEKFRDEVDEITEIALDFAESKLFNQIQENNLTAIIFYLKCKGKKRGYIEKQEIEVDTKKIASIPIVVAQSLEDVVNN